MIGRIPNVWEAIYMQGQIKNKGYVTKREFNQGKRESFNLGIANSYPYMIETIPGGDPTQGFIHPLTTQGDMATRLKDLGVKKFSEEPFSIKVKRRNTKKKKIETITFNKISGERISDLFNYKTKGEPFTIKKGLDEYIITSRDKKNLADKPPIDKSLYFGNLRN